MLSVFTHDDYLDHRNPGRHPESVDRLVAVIEHLKQTGLWCDLNLSESPLASWEEIGRVHDQRLIDSIVAASPSAGYLQLDPDTFMSAGSCQAVRRAVGAVTGGVSAVLDDSCDRAFCLVRPPGHHAESRSAMGFCLLNSVAVGAAVALDSVDRVAILDFDVHHCNGTVEMFQNRPEVLVCSTFQHPFYPNRMHDVVAEHIVNCPLPAGTSSGAFRSTVESNWLPALERHRPELILVSAGFDGHLEDPLAQFRLEDDDYAWITQFICDVANQYAQGRVVSTLEGGYDLDALARCVEIHIQGLS